MPLNIDICRFKCHKCKEVRSESDMFYRCYECGRSWGQCCGKNKLKENVK